MNSLRSNAAGHDDIPAQILKQTCNYVTPLLTHIMNMSFRCGVFPKLLKITIIPVHKSGSKVEINNYGLIAILPLISKVFEKQLHIAYVITLISMIWCQNVSLGLWKICQCSLSY